MVGKTFSYNSKQCSLEKGLCTDPSHQIKPRRSNCVKSCKFSKIGTGELVSAFASCRTNFHYCAPCCWQCWFNFVSGHVTKFALAHLRNESISPIILAWLLFTAISCYSAFVAWCSLPFSLLFPPCCRSHNAMRECEVQLSHNWIENALLCASGNTLNPLTTDSSHIDVQAANLALFFNKRGIPMFRLFALHSRAAFPRSIVTFSWS